MVTFGGFAFPHVLDIQMTSAHEEIDRVIPMANVSYRADRAELGRTVKLAGEIRETNMDTVRAAIDAIRALVDGIVRSLDLEDGTAAFNALLADPEYELAVGEINLDAIYSVTGKFYVPYSATLLEVS
jgi:hypothetical protein